MSTSIENAIAIVGISCKLPVGDTPEQFWRALAEGIEAVEFFDDDTLRAHGVPEEKLADPHYVKAGIRLPGRQLFDAQFFGIAPREASLMDPQQRLLLEGAYRALEHGGYAPDQLDRETGVFVGADVSSYFVRNILSNPDVLAAGDPVQLLYTNSSMATQIAYRLNLTGPALDVNTACSTSLVAVHLACRSLLLYECDMALAGGASVQAAEPLGYAYRPDSILSPDGHCRAFDAAASGVVAGQGVGLVLLKRYEDALQEGDTIYALIRGTAINNDGSAKIGYTAPSVDGQAAVLRRALAAADLRPEQIGYIECHGTGTALGDPIELTALAEVYGRRAADASTCYLGSLKTNLGHLNSAAGVVGLIKAALCLHHRSIPASLNFYCLTPKVSLDGHRLVVNDRLRDWPVGDQPARAAVSSFGIGGTNAHAVLEAHVPETRVAAGGMPLVLTLSAKTPEALARKRRDWADFLDSTMEDNFAAACYTANTGRSLYPCRFAVVAADRREAANRLRDAAPVVPTWRGVALVLHDGGAALLDTARALYTGPEFFQQTMRSALQPLDLDPSQLLDPRAPGHEPRIAAFAALYAMAALWRHWGVQAQITVCDEIGEFVAACLSGALDLQEAVRRLRLPRDATANGWSEAFTAALRGAAATGSLALLGMGHAPWRTLLPQAVWERVVGEVRAGHDCMRELTASAALLWQGGTPLAWRRFYGAGWQRMAVPTYPFEPVRHWLDEPAPPRGGPRPVAAPTLQPRPALSNPYQAPNGELEREVAAIWSALLGVADIGALDDFFDLGGHSLLATQLNARIHETFGVRLDLGDLFDMPTVAGTTELLLQRQADAMAHSAGLV